MNRTDRPHAPERSTACRPAATRTAAAPSRREAGFSLTEVLTSLAILMTLSLTAMPVFSEIQKEYNLRGAVRRVYGEMQRARMSAVARNVRFRAAVSSDGLVALQKYDIDTGAWEDVAASSASSNNTPGIYVTGTAEVIFSPDGTVTSPGYLTVLNSAGMQKLIRISRSGNIEIQ